jgi:hypothetical protein
MGALGRALGNFGSQVGEGYDISQQWKRQSSELAMQQARQKLAELMAPLQLAELQQRIASQKQSQELAPWIEYSEKKPDGSIEKGLYNQLTKERRPYATDSPGIAKYTGMRVSEDGKLYGINSITGKEEQIPGSEGTEFPVTGSNQRPQITSGPPIKGELIGKPKGTFWKSIVDGAGNTIGYTQTGAPTPHVGAGGAAAVSPQQLDALVQGIAAGTARMPTGKLAAQVLSRAAQMGVTLPNVNAASILNPLARNLYNVQSMLPAAQRAAANPESPQNSMALVSIADKLEGGSGQKQALMAAGKPFTLFGTSFGTAGKGTLSPQEAQSLLQLIQSRVSGDIQQLNDTYRQLGMTPPPPLANAPNTNTTVPPPPPGYVIQP